MRIEIYKRNRDSSDDCLGSFASLEDTIDFILDGGILGVAPDFLNYREAIDAANEFLSLAANSADERFFSDDARLNARVAGSLLREVSKMKSQTDLMAFGPLDGDGYPVFPPQTYVVSEQLIKALVLRLPLSNEDRKEILVEFRY